MKYRFEIKVSGWITREVEASSITEAEEKVSDLPWDMPLKDLQWVEAEVQQYTE
jgi:hypothetical protein